jgi:EpsI family protein
MKLRIVVWLPVAVLGVGTLLTLSAHGQRAMDLRMPLTEAVPLSIDGQRGQDVKISKAEQRVAGMSNYVMRVYSPAGNTSDQVTAAFSVYVGYYASQTRGRTIHSPKNCLPGSGWEALTSSQVAIQTPQGPVKVNHYILQRDKQRALVLYWYQGRGRIESNEYAVKWHLLRDAAVRGRSDEALVRIVVPAPRSEEEALKIATDVAAKLMPAVDKAMPS